MGRPASMFYWKSRRCFATDAGGSRRVLVKGAKSKVNRELATQKLGLLLGQLPAFPVGNRKLTLAEVFDRFLVNCEVRVSVGDLKPNSLNLYYRPYCLKLKADCGSWPADTVDQAKIMQFRAKLRRRKVSHNTQKNYLGVLRTVLRWAKRTHLISCLEDGIIPCLPRQRRQRIPTAQELEKLLAAAPPEVCDVLITILNTPVRPGDCYALRQSWVDLEANLLRLPDSKTGPRLVCLVPCVAEILSRRLATIQQPDDFVFTTKTGRRWSIRYFADLVYRARISANLGPHVTAYSCRHVWTTLALVNKVPLAAVRSLRADRDSQTILHYEHLASHHHFLQTMARQAVGLPAVAELDTPLSLPGESE